MEISREEVAHIAKLSYLNLSDKETDKYRRELSAIIGYIDKLSNADTSKVDIKNGIINPAQHLREDIAVKYENSDTILNNSPEQNDGYISVPKVIK